MLAIASVTVASPLAIKQLQELEQRDDKCYPQNMKTDEVSPFELIDAFHSRNVF